MFYFKILGSQNHALNMMVS